MTAPQVIWRNLTIPFARSVTFPDQAPITLEVVVIAVGSPSSPIAGATFVQPAGVQKVLLAQDTTVTFQLIPSHLAGLTEPVTYRIEWREGGITGRTVHYDFAMPDQDVNFYDLTDLGNIIDGENYLQQADLGVPGRVARLDNAGNVLDGAGNRMASTGSLDTLKGQLTAETVARQQGDAATAAAAQLALETQINSVLNTTAANLANSENTLNASIAAEMNARNTAEAALSARIDTLDGEVADNTETLALKADLVDGKVLISQLPGAALTTGVSVLNEAAMLALTAAQVQPGDFVKRPDGTFLLLNDDPSKVSSWMNLSTVTSVNGKTGAVSIDLTSVAAKGGKIAISQVNGLDAALDAAGDESEVVALASRVSAIEDDDTYVHTSGGVIPHTLNDSSMAYINNKNQITNKAGQVITVPGTGSVTSVNGEDGIVSMDLSDVAAEGGSVPLAQVAGAQAALDNKVNTDDTRLTNARTPTAHATTHAAGGSDPLSLATSQISGLDAILTENGLSTTSNHEARIASLELGGSGGTGDGGNGLAAWFDGTEDFAGVVNPADFQRVHQVMLKSPFSLDDGGDYTYNHTGVAPVGESYVYPYITPNGHLQLRTWDETNPVDPEPATSDDIATLTTEVNAKANKSDLTALTTTVNGKASQADLTALTTTVDDKASQSALDALSDTVDGKADQSTVSALTTAVNGKASQTDMSAAQSAITALQSGKADQSALSALSTTVDGKADQSDLDDLSDTVDGKADQSDMSAAQSAITALQSGKADLVSGKVPTTQLPAEAFSTMTEVANQAALLAQTSAQVQPGDWTIITAGSDQGNYFLKGSDPSQLSNWKKLTSPIGDVSSVNGKTGTVVLSAADVGARSLGDLLNISDVSGLQTSLDAVPTQISAATANLLNTSQVQALLSQATAGRQQVVRVSTTAVPSLSGAQSIDGQLLGAGNIVLLTGQSDSKQNGVWQINATGPWTRPPDFPSGGYLLKGTIITVSQGNINANTIWQMTAASGFIDTNANNWQRIGYCAPQYAPEQGNGITISDDTFSVKPTTGISVTSAGVGIDTAHVPMVATGTVPAGNTIATIKHNLGTMSPLVQIIDNTNNVVLAGISISDTNTVTVEFASPPSNGQYRWVAIGARTS
ncbi:hypothetical protein [Mycolicibacter kumamotonensis]|uniref:hypothetical protein n=1 Tax=Mycolicibacter kumamotonensis TaxID=354243 RepID=UPI0008064CAD|nr:hypothetical protein [Mycolicibacter kumamotonensis]